MTTYTITVPKIAKYMNANDRPNKWAKAAQTRVWRAQAHRSPPPKQNASKRCAC